MKKFMIICVVFAFLAGSVFAQVKVKQKPVSKAKLKLRLKSFCVNFEVRNIKAPKYIFCREPFLTLSVEVWNVGNMDYNPVRGQAVLYGDLFDAKTNAPIAFGTVPMNKVIKKGQFQKWTFSFTRTGLPSFGKPNFSKAKILKNVFIADEQGITNDPDYSNNIKYTGNISMKCRNYTRIYKKRGMVLRLRNLRTKKRVKKR